MLLDTCQVIETSTELTKIAFNKWLSNNLWTQTVQLKILLKEPQKFKMIRKRKAD